MDYSYIFCNQTFVLDVSKVCMSSHLNVIITANHRIVDTDAQCIDRTLVFLLRVGRFIDNDAFVCDFMYKVKV